MKRTVIFLVVLLLSGLNGIQAQKIEADLNSISIPANEWAITIDLTGFKAEKNNFSPDHSTRDILATQKSTSMSVSVFIEKAPQEGNYKDCRNYYWAKAEKSPVKKDNVSLYEKGEMAFVEHDIKEYQGQVINYHSLNAYLTYNGYWIDVHISQVDYKPEGKDLFDKIVNSIKIENPKKRNWSESFIFASQAYYNRSYPLAIKAYEDVLATEKEKVTINKTAWYLTVDNLGMAYGVSGDLVNSKRIFDYGIKMDPDYAFFYYNLACTYAEMSDIDNAIVNLESAYKIKDKVIAGETLANPKDDSSFSKFQKDKKFIQFLKKYDLK
jgi:tetratricopeptide (TPR) repeat protein